MLPAAFFRGAPAVAAFRIGLSAPPLHEHWAPGQAMRFSLAPHHLTRASMGSAGQPMRPAGHRCTRAVTDAAPNKKGPGLTRAP